MENSNLTASGKNYAAIDIAKLFFALLVVGIHTEPFGFSFILDKGFGIITRMCVPFFFVTSSYLFFLKGKDPLKYVQRIFVLYVVWCIIYLPMNLSSIRKLSPIELIVHYFWQGHDVLWYLLASTIGFLITYALSKVLKPKTVVVLGVIFLFVGCLKSTYAPLVQKITSVNIPDLLGSRNGLFYGFPYYALGLFIAKNEQKASRSTGSAVIGFVVSLCCLAAESAVFLLKFKTTSTVLWLAVFPLTYYLLMILKKTTISLPREYSVLIRKASTLVYVIHPFFLRLFHNFKYLSYFIIVSLSSIVVSALIVFLSGKKYFKWMKILF